MTKNSLFLAPARCGWCAMVATQRGEWIAEEGVSLAEALTAGRTLIEQMPPTGGRELSVQVAVPVRYGIFERLTLPSVDREELGSMMRLQFEKNLPYPIEETSFGYQILSRSDAETTLMACAAHDSALTNLCAPLLGRAVPECLNFWAMHIAAQAHSDAPACGIWYEGNQVLFGIFEKNRLGFVEPLTGENHILSMLPSVLMRAEVAGAPTEFSEVLLDPSLKTMEEALSGFFRVPVRPIVIQGGEVEDVDLTPARWRAEQLRRERRLCLRRRIMLATVAYVTVLISGFVYFGIQNRQLETLNKQAAKLQPQVDAFIERQTRWKALAPAIDKHRFAVELLFQAWRCLPSPDIRITRFELSSNQMILEGEAPNAQQAIQFAEKLKAQPELADYRFEAGPPAILPNEHAQFRIFGKQ